MENVKIEEENPDWKQWIPVYGVGRAIKDYWIEKPSVVNYKNHLLRFGISAIYQGVTTATIIEGIKSSLELLVK